jgi:hypothetical protein
MENNVLEIILGAIVGNTIAVATIGFLFKSIITHRLEKDMALYQAKIDANVKEKLSEYQSKLEKERIRLQISYGGIFEKQADAIIEIYNAVLGVDRTLCMVMHSADNKESYYEEFLDSWRTLSRKLDEKRIFIPEYVVKLLEKIEKDIFKGVNQHRRGEIRLGRSNLSNEEIEKIFKRQDKAFEIVDQMPIIKQELVVTLRNLIGVMHSDKVGEN